MKATDVIRHALAFADRFAIPMFQDMADATTIFPTPNGGNHPHWIIGHLAVTEGELYGMINGDPNPLAYWNELFEPGTEPSDDAQHYPPYDELLAKFREMRSRTLRLLDELSEEDLDRAPKEVFPGGEELFPTVGQVFTLIAMHQEFHIGQLADTRRAAGRKPLFAMGESAAT